MRQQGEYQTVLRRYLDLLEQTGMSADILAAIAHTYSDLAYSSPDETGANHEEAVAWMEKAVAQAPHDARLHAALASLYELGVLNYQRAAEEYRTAISLNPNDTWALSSAAALYGVPDKVVTLDEAISWLEHAITINPYEPNYYFRLGLLYKEANRSDDAEDVWIKSLLRHRPLDLGSLETIMSATTST